MSATRTTTAPSTSSAWTTATWWPACAWCRRSPSGCSRPSGPSASAWRPSGIRGGRGSHRRRAARTRGQRLLCSAGLFARGWLEARRMGYSRAVGAATEAMRALYGGLGVHLDMLGSSRRAWGEERLPVEFSGAADAVSRAIARREALARADGEPVGAGTRRSLLARAGGLAAGALVMVGVPEAIAATPAARRVGSGPTDRHTIGFISRIDQAGRSLVSVGWLTRVQGLPESSLYARRPGHDSTSPSRVRRVDGALHGRERGEDPGDLGAGRGDQHGRARAAPGSSSCPTAARRSTTRRRSPPARRSRRSRPRVPDQPGVDTPDHAARRSAPTSPSEAHGPSRSTASATSSAGPDSPGRCAPTAAECAPKPTTPRSQIFLSGRHGGDGRERAAG